MKVRTRGCRVLVAKSGGMLLCCLHGCAYLYVSACMLLLCRTRRPHKRPHLCRRVEGVLKAEHKRVRAAVEQREHVPLGSGVLQVLREGGRAATD